MMSDQEMNERINAMTQAGRFCNHGMELRALQYAIAVHLCHKHQFTAAAEGLLEAAERMVGIEREEKA